MASLKLPLGTTNGTTNSVVAVLEAVEVVVVVAAERRVDAVDALRSGADDFLYKPLDPAGLLRTLHREEAR